MAFRATIALLLGAAAPVWAKDIVVTFPDRGADYPKGTIVLSQASVAEPLYITTNLQNLEAGAAAALGNNWHGAPLPSTHHRTRALGRSRSRRLMCSPCLPDDEC